MSSTPRPPTARRRPAPALAAVLVLTLAAGLLLAPTAALGAAASPEDDPVHLDTEEQSAERSWGRTVEAELAPDGDVVTARVRRHERDGSGGGVTERVEEIDEARIPIAVRVRYELDGEQVTARELRGASGEAAVRIQLRNPTAEPRTVTRPDSEDEDEVDLSLPMVADGLLTFDDTWHELTTDAGRLAPGAGGASRLRWSSALFEPFTGATDEVEVRGRVEDAALPRLEIDASPVTAASNDLLRVLERRARDVGTSDAVAAFIADNLGEGLTGAAEGAGGLADGLEQARAGAGEVAGGLEQVQEQLGGGLDELQEGLERLDEGLGRIAEGLERVEEGLGQVVEGLDGLEDGIGEARQGAARLRDDIAAPAEDAVREAWRALGERFTVGRMDPAYQDAVRSVGELHALLTGQLPTFEDLEQAPVDEEQQEELAGLLARIAAITGEEPPSDQEDMDDLGEGAEELEDYPGLEATLDQLAGGLDEASSGAGQLAEAVEGITAGLTELRHGLEQMREMLDRAAPDVEGPERDPQEMAAGLAEFESAMRRLAEGGHELADGLDALDEGGEELLERLEDELDEANLDLATIEALSQRASEPVDTSEQEAVGGHDRYLLVMHEEQRSGAPIAGLTGLAMLAATLEVLRRRLTAV